MCNMSFLDSRRIKESARIGSTESSEGSILVKATGFPSNQVAMSREKFSAMNLQVLSKGIIISYSLQVLKGGLSLMTHF